MARIAALLSQKKRFGGGSIRYGRNAGTLTVYVPQELPAAPVLSQNGIYTVADSAADLQNGSAAFILQNRQETLYDVDIGYG